MRRDSSETKRKILTVCVRLFLEQGYKNTSVSQIVDEAGVARGSYLNLFPTKDRILLELTETMFGGQFGVARSIADSKLPPVYAYAVETAIQLTLTELNENLREIYIEAYSLPDTSEYIYLHTTAELKQIFGENFPDDTESDFYEMEIGTAGLMRSYMARKCDIHFPLERKLSRFLTASMRVYRVPEEEQAKVLAFIQSLDIRAIATKVMYKLFAMLEMKQKQGASQLKRSLRVTREDAQALTHGDYAPLLRYSESFAAECYALMHSRCYRPKTIVEYDRKAFIAKENKIRITFDSRIVSVESCFDLFSPRLNMNPVLDPYCVVLEVKYNGFLLDYLRELLNSVDRSELSVSKYVLARQNGCQTRL